MEITREFRVTIYRDTNKQTYTQHYESAVEAVKVLLPMPSDEEREEVLAVV